MEDCEDFIQKFHSLEGVTLKERKISFYRLLKTVSASSKILDTIIQRLSPTTYLEETYKIELLIHFKRTNELLEILKNGEEIGACKIVRQDWFIVEVMNKYSSREFITEIVPHLSFSIRLKIFKRIYVNFGNANIMEELFEEIIKLYGISSAKIFLPGCNKETIVKALQDFSIHFSSSQMKLLLERDKDIIIKYFEILKNNNIDIDCYKWRSFFVYMGKVNPLFYFEICEKFGMEKIRLGRKSTLKFINVRREHIVLKPNDYVQVLRKDVLVRKLGSEFPIFYRNLLPEKLIDFRFFPGKSLIKYFPKKKQYELYYNTFEEVYGKCLWDNVNYMDQKLIELIPEKDVREKWVLKFENRQNIKKYIRRKKCAMYFVEDKKNVIKKKKTIFNTLISSCKLTDNYDAFLNILKSFCERHRNSDVTIVYNFLRTIYEELDLNKFTDEHWQCIYDIITIQLFKKQQIYHPIFLQYINFLYINQKPIDDYVSTFLNEAPLDLSKYEYKNRDFEKNMHSIYLKLLPKITNRKNEVAIQIALSLIRWNEKYPLEAIGFSSHKAILIAIRAITSEKSDGDSKKVFKYLICTQKENQFCSDLDDIYWTYFNKLGDNTITNWFIKYNPLVFKEHINKIGIILKNKNTNIIHQLKKYSHLGIPDSITALCLEELNESEASKCGRIVKILLLFMEKSDLHLYMMKKIPNTDKVGSDVLDKKVHSIQCALARHLKLTENLTMFLPILLQYCRGNVFSSALASLYSSFHRIPESQIYPALHHLESGPVSVRKHTIFLTSLILPKEYVISKYKQVQSSEQNSSVKQHMFMSCQKYFIKNESPDCWPIIKKYLEQMTDKRKGVLKMMTNVHFIPTRYRTDYTKMVWNIFEKFKTDPDLIDDNMFALLNNLKTDDIIRLDIEFCKKIIEKNLFDYQQCSIDKTVAKFSRKFFLYAENSEEKVHIFHKVLRELKENNSEVVKQMKYLDLIYEFCFRLFTDIISTEETKNFDSIFVKNFKQVLMKIFAVEEIFEEMLILDSILFKIEFKDYKIMLPKQMSRLFSTAIQQYGYLIMNRFKGLLGNILENIYVNDECGILVFLNSFLGDHCTSEHYLLVIDLMPHISYATDDQSKINAYEELLTKLSGQDQMIKIRLYGKLKNM